MSNITIINGNIFNTKAQTIVNTVNCVGVMGKGIALVFKLRYPSMFDIYQDFCKQGLIGIGKLWIYKGDARDPWVLNFPTKTHWKLPSKYEYIEKGLQKFVETYKEKGITSIAFPLLGANNGGLDGKKVEELMIGDWVYDGNSIAQVTGITCDGIIETTHNQSSNIEIIRPIPLTIEILEKNGLCEDNHGRLNGEYFDEDNSKTH